MIHIYDRLLNLMARDGFKPEAAMFAFSSAMSLVLGSVLVERMMHGAPPVPALRLALIKGLVDGLPPERYPHVAVVSECFDRWNFEAVFELELKSLLIGLEGCARRGRTARRRRSA